MDGQLIIVGIVVLGALALTAVRLAGFFHNPVHKCEGCSGCSLTDLKKEIEAKKENISV